MTKHVRPALVLLLLFTVLGGVLFPLAITGVAQIALPYQANGSLLEDGDTTTGSALIGQRFATGRYFNGRPSAAGVDGYDASASSGSNLGPLSKRLVERAAGDVKRLKPQAGGAPVPVDAVTTSASGLDPDISPAYARLQARQVAASRGLAEATVEGLIERHIQGRLLGVLGEPRVNVLLLNRALDALPSS